MAAEWNQKSVANILFLSQAHTELIEGAFQDLSPEELQQLAVELKKDR
jgi:hypothetical protein